MCNQCDEVIARTKRQTIYLEGDSWTVKEADKMLAELDNQSKRIVETIEKMHTLGMSHDRIDDLILMKLNVSDRILGICAYLLADTEKTLTRLARNQYRKD